MWLYVILHLVGYKVTLDDIKSFRQVGSKCPGHPEYGATDGVENTSIEVLKGQIQKREQEVIPVDTGRDRKSTV